MNMEIDHPRPCFVLRTPLPVVYNPHCYEFTTPVYGPTSRLLFIFIFIFLLAVRTGGLNDGICTFGSFFRCIISVVLLVLCFDVYIYTFFGGERRLGIVFTTTVFVLHGAPRFCFC
ncbi:hypothetical protein QBC40DRAFT_12112 [Triangularia verruculosa]|uniref:Transmembrane protein n=1 Tax=Triangularia verruculosa TaxID=2587418 RepID=A0AAN6XNU3_9PEZI|nr:hypothetical protein QBC40DRAFT_12112 [Triangularia verruculosa]